MTALLSRGAATRRRVLAAAALAAAAPRQLRATEAFPARPIRIVVGAAPGSAPDIALRLLAERLAGLWRQPVIVDNRVGAAGNLGAQAVARAPGDGHVLLFAQASPIVLNQHLMRAMPFDPARDLAPVSLLLMTPFILAARPGLEVATLDDLLRLARQAPGRITFASSGATSLPRFAAEQLARRAGVELSNIPYNGSPPALQDTLGGRVDLVIDGTPLLAPQIRARALTPLAITSAARFPGLEEVPAIAETFPGFQRVGWFGLLAPAATPAGLVARLAQDVGGVLEAPELRRRLLAEIGAETVGGTPEAFARFIAAEREELGLLSRQLGVVIE